MIDKPCEGDIEVHGDEESTILRSVSPLSVKVFGAFEARMRRSVRHLDVRGYSRYITAQLWSYDCL